MSEDYNPDIVSVVDEEGKEHVFEELDRIETDTGRYVALVPLYDNFASPEEAQAYLEDSGELIILKVTEEDGETYLSPIEDDKEFDEIGELFEERLEEKYDFGDDEEDEVETDTEE